MKRTAAISVLLAGLSGCMSPSSGSSQTAHPMNMAYQSSIPNVQGPMGEPVPMMARAKAPDSSGAQLAQAIMMPPGMMAPGMVPPGGMPPSAMPGGGMPSGGSPSGVMLASATDPNGGSSGVVRAGGVCLDEPGGPGGVKQAGCCSYGPPVPNAVAAVGAITGPGGPRFPTRRSEVRFVGPAGMKISWPGVYGEVRNNQIEAPGRYNFVQGSIYRLKLSDLPGRPGVDLYPTLEVVPANLRTDAYIAHSSVPLYFTEEDFEQVMGGNFLVKVIYLPNPQYADVAMTGGPEEVVSTRLEPGADPIAEACKRGSILLIIRMGNIDLEAPHTPPMNAPPPMANPFCAGPMPGLPMAPGMPMQGMPMMAGGMPMQAPGIPGGMVMQPPAPPQIPGPPMIPVTPVASDKAAPSGPSVPPTVGPPVSKLPDASPVNPVKFAEPMNAPTPAQVAGQGK